MTRSPEIQGFCDDKFDGVRTAFAENFQSREELGASVAVVLEGELVVDLWGGFMDEARTKPWHADTIVNAWSLGKAMSALSILHHMDNSDLDPSDRISDYWHEFAENGKRDITFEIAMSHRGGLCGVEASLPADAFLHWDMMAAALAAQAPWWEPGSAHGYHTNTFGFLLGEPLRRITGQRIKDYFRNEIAGPLNADFHMGVSQSDLVRCADLLNPPRPQTARAVPEANATTEDPLARMRYFIYNNPSLSEYDYNSDAWRCAEFPSTSPQGNARGVARIFGELASIVAGKENGIVSREILGRAIEITSDGNDLNILRPTRFGLGFQLTQPDRPLGPHDGTFGHYGNGGHLGFADPTVPLGFAYHMNHQGYAWRDPRNIALTDALYDAL